MPGTRDQRLSRHDDNDDDVVSAYSRRRNTRTGGSGSPFFILEDESYHIGRISPETPFRWRGAAMVGAPGPTGSPADDNAENETPLHSDSENLPSPAVGSRGTPLPVWYPRRPLNEITTLVRAIERSEQRRRGSASQETEGPVLQDPVVVVVRDPSPSRIEAEPERNSSLIAAFPTIPRRSCTPTIAQECKGGSSFLTPEKKLLHNIETVERVVMEELQKLKSTPSAKREERQKRVRKLMSMR